jgi:L-fucose mutarotase/ribose pyranase (RbsD/FucU family)
MSACYSEVSNLNIISDESGSIKEDFIAIFSFENSILTFDEVLKNLNKVEEAVLMRIKAKQNKQENMALLNRIRFYQQILIAFESLVPASDRPASSTDKKWQPQIGFGKAAIKTSLTHMQNSCDTIKLGRQPSDGNDADYSWLNCFQPKVNQHTLPPTFPKEIKFMSRLAGYNYIISIFQSVLNMLEEMPQPNNIISLDTLLEFFERYSYAGVITRSMNQLILLPVDDCLFGVRPMVDLVSCSISEFAPSIQQDKL